MFGLKHCVILACSILLIIGFVFLSKKWDIKKCGKAFMILGLLSETVKIFCYIVRNEDKLGGLLPKTDLPFQLCSIQILFILIVQLTKNERVKRVLLAFMMPSALVGGAAAIVLPTSSSLNVWVITFQYFIYHSALVAFGIRLLTDKELSFSVRDYSSSLLFVVGLLFFAVYVNSIVYDGVTEVNFMYVVSPPSAGLPFLNEKHGWLVYITHYAMLVWLAITACYAKPIYRGIKNAKKRDG